jgi:hypothetical protein
LWEELSRPPPRIFKKPHVTGSVLPTAQNFHVSRMVHPQSCHRWEKFPRYIFCLRNLAKIRSLVGGLKFGPYELLLWDIHVFGFYNWVLVVLLATMVNLKCVNISRYIKLLKQRPKIISV